MNDIIHKYLLGEASGKQKEALLMWLREKEENRILFSEIRDEWLADSACAKPRAENTKKAFQTFMEWAKQREKKRKQIQLRTYFKTAAVAAVLVICSVSAYWMGSTGIGREKKEPEVAIINRVRMGKESKGSIHLPDGSKVWLNANSQLIYPEYFTKDTRLVELQGEGYFEVIKDEKAPFIVKTDGMQIRVLGTHFNVNNYKHQGAMEIALLSGKVEVCFPDITHPIFLKPNQKISRNKYTGNYQLADVEAADYAVWIGDKLICTNETLSSILHKMKHWYNLDIECKQGVPLNLRLSLTIRKESPDEIFKLLTLISPIRYRWEKDKIIVSPQYES